MASALEQVLMNFYKEEMITFLKSHPEFFNNTIELALKDEQPLSWRSAWLLWSCIEINDKRIRNNIDKILTVLPSKQDGHQRELIKILLQMKLNEEQEGKLFNICMTLWEGLDKKPSIRYTAFKFIIEMTKKYPELKSEVEYLTQEHYLEPLSPGIKHSISRIIKDKNYQKKLV